MWQQRTNVLMDKKLHLRVCLYEQDCDKLAGNLLLSEQIVYTKLL